MTEEEQIITQSSLIAKKLGFNESEAKVLALLVLSNKSLSQKEIQEKLKYSPAIVSKAINRLLSERLVIFNKRIGKEKEYYTEVGFIDIFSLIIERIIKRDIEPTMKMIEEYMRIKAKKNIQLKKILEEYRQSKKYSQIIKELLEANKDTIEKVQKILSDKN